LGARTKLEPKERTHEIFTKSNIQHRTSNIQVPFEVCAWHEGEKIQRNYDLEERLLEFASRVIDLTERLPQTRAGNHVGAQILGSGTSPFPNHGEVEEAESREDFIHKLKVCLKELRETRRWARLIQLKGWVKNDSTLDWLLSESDELIGIFYSSIQTAKRNTQAARQLRSAS